MSPAATQHRSLVKGVSTGAVLSSAWPALLLSALCLLPFLNKAFIIDDPHFLKMAQQIIKHPLHPMDFDICWNLGATCSKAYDLTPGNALVGYALVPIVLAGAPEWMAHLMQIIFAWVGIVATASLILRFGWNRDYAMGGALLLVALPPFLPMASTAMPDTLAMTVAVVAMERLAAWKAEGKWLQGLAAALGLGLAGFARAHLSLLLPLAAFFLLDSVNPRQVLAQIRNKPWLWSPVVAGSLLLAVIIAVTRENSLALNPPVVFRGPGNIPRNLRSYLMYLAFPLPLAACWAANRWKIARTRLLAIPVSIVLLVGLMASKATFLSALATSFAFVGLAALADLTFEAYRKKQQEGIFLMLWLLIPLPIVYYGHLPIKYLLPCAPALILVCMRLSMVFPARTARAAGVVLIVAGAGYSLLILRSDAEFAEFGRSAMNRLIRPAVAAGQKVWFCGEFSAYWYAPPAGAKLSVLGDNLPKPGDLVVVGIFEGGKTTLERFPNRTLVQAISHTYRFGRTMGNGLGLYTNLTGSWLWGFGSRDENRDRYELWKITEPHAASGT